MNQITNLQTTPYDQQAWKHQLSDVRFELDRISLSPSEAAKSLLRILRKFQTVSTISDLTRRSTIPIEGRIEILLAIKSCASPKFYSSWMHETYGLGLIESWLVEAVFQINLKTQGPSSEAALGQCCMQHDEISFYILEMLGKLPLTVQILRVRKFGKCVRRINLSANSAQFTPKVSQLSGVLEERWLLLIRQNRPELEVKSEEETPGDSAGDLRHKPSSLDFSQIEDNSTGPIPNPPTHDSLKHQQYSSIAHGAAKKRKVFISAEPTTQQPELSLFERTEKLNLSTSTQVQTANNTFQTVPPAATSNVHDPFSEAMGLLKHKPNNNLMFVDNSPEIAFHTNVTAKNNRKSPKRVRFPPEDQLCKVKVIERLSFEGEEYETTSWISEEAQRIDACEGRFLHPIPPVPEEEMEWETPLEVVLTDETIHNLETLPLVSFAAIIQEEREKRWDTVTHEEVVEIPETPKEPEADPNEENETETIGLPRLMKLSRELSLDPDIPQSIAHVEVGDAIHGVIPTDQAISDLLERLDADSHTILRPPELHFTSHNILTETDLNQASKCPQPKEPTFVPPMVGSSSKSRKPIPIRTPSNADLHCDEISTNHVGIHQSHDNPDGFNSPNAMIKRKSGQIPCRWGSRCRFGQRCYYKHDWN